MLFVAVCCSFWFLVRVSIVVCCFCCSSLLVLIFEIESILNLNQNRQMPLVAHFGFLLFVLVFCRCFHLKIAFARFGLLLV